MKKTMLMNVALLVLATALIAAPMTAQKADPAELQLKAVIQKEVEDGDLKGAIALYSKLAENPNRAVAAKALVRMGECYEKLGDTEARKAYERVVREFADQKESLAAAQKHLAESAGPSAPGVTMQRIATFPDPRRYTSISRDGRYLAFKKRDGIYLRDLVKSEEHRIVQAAPDDEVLIFPDGKRVAYQRNVAEWPAVRSEIYVIDADGSNQRLLFSRTFDGKKGEELYLSAISPDGKLLACSEWKEGPDNESVFILDTDGSKPRVLFTDEKGEYIHSVAWSPDGKHLLAGISNDAVPLASRLLLVSLADGSFRVIGSSSDEGRFSPDGHSIAFYRYPHPKAQIEEGLYVAGVERGEATLVVRGAVSNPIWTPDGKRILFRNRRPDQSDPRNRNPRQVQEPCDLYSIRVVDGKPDGKPELMIKDALLSARLLGSTPEGSFYYGYTANESANIYVVNLDPTTGKAVSKPSPVYPNIDYANGDPPRWSPDGQWFTYYKKGALMIGSAITGEEHELVVSPPFDTQVGWWPIQWFPDNRSILVCVLKNSRVVFCKVDVQDGTQRMFFERPGDEMLFGAAALSLDGREIFFSLCKPGSKQPADQKNKPLNTLRLMRRNMESGEEKELYQANSPSAGFTVMTSSDGQQLAILRQNLDNTSSLLTIPAIGGDARELYRSDLSFYGPSLGWSKEGSHIFIVQSDPSSRMMQLSSVSAQSGERVSTGVTMSDIRGPLHDPDGRRLIFWGRQPGQSELWVMKLLPSGPKP